MEWERESNKKWLCSDAGKFPTCVRDEWVELRPTRHNIMGILEAKTNYNREA